MLVSEDSSTCMLLLEVGNWILRGTKTVETAGTLVAFGLLRESSGLLLDLLVELGSSGGETPDILTNALLRTAATSRREQSSTSRESQKTKKDQMRHYVQNQTSLRNEWISMYKCKIKFRMKSYGCGESCVQQQTRRKDKDDPKRVASRAQLPLSSDA